MTFSKASIDHHEHAKGEHVANSRLGTALCPPPFDNPVGVDIIPISRCFSCGENKPHVSTNGLESLLLRADRYSRNLNCEIDHNVCRTAISTGNSIIYQGILRPSGKQIAIKSIIRFRPDSDMVKRTLREVHVWSKLCHEHILPLLGIITGFDGTVSIVTEWMARGNAHDYVQDANVDPRPLILDVARGIFYLHSHTLGPIIHGDLKGMNVLISPEGRALLTDFGHSHLTSSSFSMTANTPRGGTWNWLAPEIVSEEYVTIPPRDIWAFGMTVLELFSRKIPFFDAENVLCVLLRIQNGRLPERPNEECTRSRMTDAWWSLCNRCWERNPLSRPTISDLIIVIEQLH